MSPKQVHVQKSHVDATQTTVLATNCGLAICSSDRRRRKKRSLVCFTLLVHNIIFRPHQQSLHGPTSRAVLPSLAGFACSLQCWALIEQPVYLVQPNRLSSIMTKCEKSEKYRFSMFSKHSISQIQKMIYIY